mmetsp:Transcript_24457/g.43391  ORF Transcript_24457/g.43391 Transcript_24457/m.43391 type:complete len:96 (+) Transcript_24457:660-947(+)
MVPLYMFAYAEIDPKDSLILFGVIFSTRAFTSGNPLMTNGSLKVTKSAISRQILRKFREFLDEFSDNSPRSYMGILPEPPSDIDELRILVTGSDL